MKFGVIGVGRFGYHVATTLADNGMEVLAIDSNESVVASIQDKVTQAICMQIIDEDSLRSVGMDEMDTVIVAMGENFAQSILVTAILKQKLQVKQVIARSVSQIHKDILKLVGADNVILPEKEEGIRLANNLSLNFAALIQITPEFSVSQLKTPKKLVGKQVGLVQSTYHVTCIGKKEQDTITPFDHLYVLKEEDVLILSGLNRDLERIAKI